MYLSRLILNPRSRRVQSEVSDPYQMHRSLMRAFPDGVREVGERTLFRVDAEPRFAGPALLVQSRLEPDWSWLGEPEARGYLLPLPEPNPWVKRFELHLEPGQVLAFRLRANPTVRRAGKRLGLYREEQQLAWLARKAQAAGFEPVGVHVCQEHMRRGTLHRERVEHRLELLSVRFDGYLRVTDPQRLAGALAAGIGSGKGFGFGLLSLARLQS